MNYTAILLTLIPALSGYEITENPGQGFEWPGGTRTAVCLTYDDALDCHLDNAVPALDRYGLKGTFYCTGQSPSLQKRTDEWREIAANGHELGNHTLFHPCDASRADWVKHEYDLTSYTLEQILNELFTANTLLKAIDGKEERSFAYTCTDHRIENNIDFATELSGLFPAARAGGPVPSSIDEIDPYLVPSWPVDEPTGEDLIRYAKEALEKGTLAVFMFHSVGGGYLNVSDEAHEQLLKYLNSNRDLYWTDTFLDVMKYWKSKTE